MKIKLGEGTMTMALFTFFAGLGIAGFVMLFLLLLFPIAMIVYGLYLTFSASILLGIVVLLLGRMKIVQSFPFFVGTIMFFFDKNLAQMLVDFLTK